MNEAREPSASYQTHYEPKPNPCGGWAKYFCLALSSASWKTIQKIDRTFQTVVSTFRRMVIVNNLQKTEQRLYGELVRPTEASQVLTAPVVEQQLHRQVMQAIYVHWH